VLERKRSDDENVDRIAVIRDGVRDVAVVARVVHRRRHEAVDEQRTRGLVDLVLDRIGVHRDFDHNVEVFGHVATL